jgi:hypothetical protein
VCAFRCLVYVAILSTSSPTDDPFEKRCNDLFCMNLEPTKTSKSLFRLESAQQNEDDHGE